MTTIPAFHVSGRSATKAKAVIFIASRKDAVSSGTFTITVVAQFDPGTDEYPGGSVTIDVDLSDSLKSTFKSTSIELINSYGKHNPTLYLTGRCKASTDNAPKGLRYWIILADNRRDNQGTPEIAGFAIHDRSGNRVAYGTGPVKSGSIDVVPT